MIRNKITELTSKVSLLITNILETQEIISIGGDPLGKIQLTNIPHLDKIGANPSYVLKRRVRNRYKHLKGIYPKLPEKTFSELFQLPEWLPLRLWILIALRGRPVGFLMSCSVEHIVPLSWARNEEEVLKLFSHLNTRLLDKEQNERKSNHEDEENRELCFHLLGRYP